jgi:hypothetical protein
MSILNHSFIVEVLGRAGAAIARFAAEYSSSLSIIAAERLRGFAGGAAISRQAARKACAYSSRVI